MSKRGQAREREKEREWGEDEERERKKEREGGRGREREREGRRGGEARRAQHKQRPFAARPSPASEIACKRFERPIPTAEGQLEVCGPPALRSPLERPLRPPLTRPGYRAAARSSERDSSGTQTGGTRPAPAQNRRRGREIERRASGDAPDLVGQGEDHELEPALHEVRPGVEGPDASALPRTLGQLEVHLRAGTLTAAGVDGLSAGGGLVYARAGGGGGARARACTSAREERH